METNSERISTILYKKLVEKKNTLKYFELNVDRDGIKEEKVVEMLFGSNISPNKQINS